MATILREFLLGFDDKPIEENVKYLLNEMKDKKCTKIQKNGKVCGQQLKWTPIWPSASCRYRHESRSELLQAICKKEKEEYEKKEKEEDEKYM